MLWTWVLVCLITGELIVYLILEMSKKLLPYEISPRVRSRAMFYILCLGIFVIGGISFFSFKDTRQRLSDLDRLYEQLTVLTRVNETIIRMESSQRGYLITGKDSYLEDYNEGHEDMEKRCGIAVDLYRGTPDQVRMETLCTLVGRRIEMLDRNIELKKSGKKEEVEHALVLKEGTNVMDLIVTTWKDMRDRKRSEYDQIMSGLRALGAVRVYLSVALMVAALFQIGMAASLGRSRRPIPLSGERSAG